MYKNTDALELGTAKQSYGKILCEYVSLIVNRVDFFKINC